MRNGWLALFGRGYLMLAARMGDMTVCPMLTVLVPHVGGPIVMPATPLVLVGGVPVAGIASLCTCIGPPATVAKGSATVLAGGKPVARLGDTTAHGGTIIMGCPTVLVGG
jgi:uncharacterized Zn-binding protein involved in type VI secretion